MKRSKRFTPLLDFAESRAAQAALVLGKSQQKLEVTQERLQSLISLRDNYTAKFYQSCNQGLGVQQLTEYRAFLHKINAAINEQEQALLQAESDVNARRSNWQAARQRAASMKKLIDKARAEENGRQQKKDQAELDERAGKRNDEELLILHIPQNP